MKTRSHGVVVGYRSEDQRRYLLTPQATIRGGACISCRADVFINSNGVSALRERDADVICWNCNRAHAADVDRSLIES